MINPLTFLYDFTYDLMKMAQNVWNWLFDEVTIGTWQFRPILLVGGSLLVVLIVAKLVKDFVPLV